MRPVPKSFKCGHARADNTTKDGMCRECKNTRRRKITAFRCGHPVIRSNTRMVGKYRRCVACDKTRAERKNATPIRRFKLILPPFNPFPSRQDISGRSYELANQQAERSA
jgi:hypothetical protein